MLSRTQIRVCGIGEDEVVPQCQAHAPLRGCQERHHDDGRGQQHQGERELSGVSPATRLRIPSKVTYAARM